MNIIVWHNETISSIRPDNTWERENKDCYAPQGVASYVYRPVLFAKMTRAGKCIGEKFVERYFESIGFGLLLSPQNAFGTTAGECYDGTSRLCHPLFNKITLNDEYPNTFTVFDGENQVYSYKASSQSLNDLENTICQVSRIMSLKVGDFVCICLNEPQKLSSQQISATFCENNILDFKIIY